jgi:cyanophycinase
MTSPKGFLVAIGGAEDKGGGEADHRESNDLDFYTEGVLKDIRELMKGKEPVIEVITTATSSPEESFKNYEKAFKKLGAIPHHLNITNRMAAEDKKNVQRMEKCNGVMITGGDQTRLSSVLGGTILQEVLQERYRSDHFVIAGTSAGAACMSGTMMGGGSSDKGNIKGEVELTLGLGFINNVIIDTHFDTRVRFARLAEAIATQPGIIGIGLGEDTAVIVENGTVIKAIGSDSVTIIDGSEISYNNIAEIKDGKPISIAKLNVYLLARFDRFDFKKRAFTPAPSPGREN